MWEERVSLSSDLLHDGGTAGEGNFLFVAQGFHEQALQGWQRLMARQVEQVADVMTVARRQAAMQPPGRRQTQTRTRTAKRHAFIGDNTKKALARHLVAHRGSVYWRVGLQVFVVFTDQAEQLLQADELLQERVGILGQMAHAHQFDKAQLVATLKAIVKKRQKMVQVLPAQRD